MNQVIALAVTLIFLGITLYYTVTHKLKDRYAFLWLSIACSGVIAALSIPLLNRLAERLGIAYMPTFIMMLAILFILGLLIRQTVSLSRQADRIKTLTQELALLEKQTLELGAALARGSKGALNE